MMTTRHIGATSMAVYEFLAMLEYLELGTFRGYSALELYDAAHSLMMKYGI